MRKIFLALGACGVAASPIVATISCNQSGKVEMKEDGIFHKNATAVRIFYEI